MPDTVLKLSNITKSFGGNVVLNKINLELEEGQVHAIVGENGAGKSVLVQVIAGIHRKDSGEIEIDGKRADILSPKHARNYGISVIFQETFLFDHFTIAENIFLKDAPIKIGLINAVDMQKLYGNAQDILDRLEFPLDARTCVRELNLAQRRMVEIARAFTRQSRIIIMDEPTSSISRAESLPIFKMINLLKANGKSILYISHRLEDVLEIADKITIIKKGIILDTFDNKNIDYKDVIDILSINSYKNAYPILDVKKGKEVFSVRNLCVDNYLDDINFTLYQGEILGISGLAGSGRSELAKTLFGFMKKSCGAFYMNGHKVRINSIMDSIKHGVAYIPENRMDEGAFLNLSIIQNLLSTQRPRLLKNSMNSKDKALRYINKVHLEADNLNNQLFTLSGGNQQKLLLIKWFITNSRIFIFNEPTKGIDVASKVDIYNLMNDLIRKGASLIIISSDVDELIGISDRIIVLYNGAIIKEFGKETATVENINYYCYGGK